MTHPASLAPNETDRLAALRALLVLDSGPEPLFDSIAKMAADICGTPIALVSLIDEERQWFKAEFGLHGVHQTPRDIAFCAHAILQESVFQVPDASRDPRFAANPLVTSSPNIRFYAGAPLVLGGGERIGTLCVIDRQARKLSDQQVHMLQLLSTVVSDALAMRRDLVHKSLSVRSEYERMLSHSESHYRAIVDDQEELVSLALPNGDITYANPAYARHFGKLPHEMVGINLFDLVDPADRGAVKDLLETLVRTGQNAPGENRVVGADGASRWVAWTNGIQRDADGTVLLHSVGRDVSERKQAEQDLRASQAFLYRTGRAAGVGGWEVDLVTNSVTWSEETRRIHEVPPDYKPTFDNAVAFYTPEARATIESAVATAIERGDSWDLELPMVTATGRHIWVRAMGEVDYAGGNAVRLVGALQDVTQRKQLEHNIAAQTATLRLVTEAIPATVAVFGMDGLYSFANSAFERACGRTREQIVGFTGREVLGNEEFERRWPWVKRAFAGESVVFELDYPSIDDYPRHVSISYVPLRLDSGQLDGFVAVTQDVTQQKSEVSRLRELSQRDPLTGLLNRAGFEKHLEHHMREGTGASLALLYIDLDGFKAVNDLHGHATGDRVLQAFAKRLAKLVRPVDAVTRLGGDEFAIALTGVREQIHADTVADKVVHAGKAAFDISGTIIQIGASVGVAFKADPTAGWVDLVERADANLLAAKAAGKGRYE